jgi:hypothetical protein
MPHITIFFPNPINTSVQVGDTAYYLSNITEYTNPSGTHTHSNYSDIIQIGEIVCVNQSYGALCVGKPDNSITCNWDPNPPFSPFPPIGAFIMFSKDNKANLSSLLGYYAEIQFVNNSSTKAELFSVGADVFISSK